MPERDVCCGGDLLGDLLAICDDCTILVMTIF